MAESLFVAGVDEPSGDFDDASANTYATGLTFAVAGLVTHIRFRFPNTPSPTCTGVLYQITNQGAGVELARATFVAPPSEAWGTVALPGGGVAVSAAGTGKAYRAAVYASTGRYTATGGYFTGGSKTAGNITAFQDNTSPVGAGVGALRNGAFGSGDTYPTGFFSGGCYFADVVFEAGASPSTWTYGHQVFIGG